MTHRPRSRWLGALLALSLLAAACGESRAPATSAPAPPATSITATGASPAASPAVAASPASVASPAAASKPAQVTAGPGVTDTSIKVGVISALTGPIALQGLPITAGQDSFFKYANDRLGGVAGRKFEVVKQDFQNNPQLAQQAYATVQPQVALFSQLFGAPAASALRDRVRSDSMLAVVASAAPANLYLDEHFLMGLGPPYAVQTAGLVDWAIKTKNGQSAKWAVLYRNDDFGKAGLEGFDFAAGFYKLNVVTRQTYTTTDQDFTAQIQALKDSGADFVVTTMTSSISPKVLVGAFRANYKPTWLSFPTAYDPTLQANDEFMQVATQVPYFVVSSVPSWDTNSAAMQTMRDAVKQYAPDQAPDPLVVTGWTMGQMTYDVLSKAFEAGDVTRAGLLAVVPKLGKTDLGGLAIEAIDFTRPANQRVPRAIQVLTVDRSGPGGLKAASDFFTGDAAKAFEVK